MACCATLAICTWSAAQGESLPDRRAVRPGPVPGASLTASPQGGTVAELVVQIEALQTELRRLRGQVEVQGYQLERLKAGNRDLAADFDRRLKEIENRASGGVGALPSTSAAGVLPSAGSATGAGAPPVAPPPTATVKPPASTAPTIPATAAVQKEYDAAFALLKQGLYERAAQSFREFITRHPRSQLADNAQYWVGEASYVLRNFRLAEEEFTKVLNEYPNSPKVPDAMLKLGYSLHENGAVDQARTTLNQVVARFPNTAAAKSAEQRLARLTKEGR